MPRNATTEQRITWHIEHAAACGCRPIPDKLAAEMKRRGIRAKEPTSPPARRHPPA